MTRTATAADVMVAKDAWVVAANRRVSADAAWEANACEMTNAAQAATRKAEQRAWANWQRVEAMAV